MPHQPIVILATFIALVNPTLFFHLVVGALELRDLARPQLIGDGELGVRLEPDRELIVLGVVRDAGAAAHEVAASRRRLGVQKTRLRLVSHSQCLYPSGTSIARGWLRID